MVGENIKKYRKELGLTQAELAEKLYVEPQTISFWENGKRQPDIDTLVLLAEIFNVSMDELFGKTVEKPAPEVITEIKYVYDEKQKVVLALCRHCKNPIFEKDELTLLKDNTCICNTCVTKIKEEQERIKEEQLIQLKKMEKIRLLENKRLRKNSFIWGGIATGLWLILVFYWLITGGEKDDFWYNLGFSPAIFTLVSCGILKNNFMSDVLRVLFRFKTESLRSLIVSIFKYLFFILLVILICILLGFSSGLTFLINVYFIVLIILGFISIFVYPFAIYRNIFKPELTEGKF